MRPAAWRLPPSASYCASRSGRSPSLVVEIRQPLDLFGELPRRPRRFLDPVLGHQAQQEGAGGALQFRGGVPCAQVVAPRGDCHGENLPGSRNFSRLARRSRPVLRSRHD